MDNQFNLNSPPTVDTTGETVPSYLTAADNHNIGNSLGGSWYDPDTWSTNFNNKGKFIAVSVLSGADSLYNTAATVGSWAGIGDGAHDTAKFISGLDDDLGAYYQKNRDYADLAGFVLTSFVPGLVGIKLFNVGQTALKGAKVAGMLGSNLSRATGLLVPEAEAAIQMSARSIVEGKGAISMLNRNTLQALAAGAGQQALEAAAFETAVQATMFKSPILSDETGYDIAKNIAFGGLVGGVIGGAFSGAKVISSINSKVATELRVSAPMSAVKQVADITPAGQKAILVAEDMENTAVPIDLSGDAYPLGDSMAVNNLQLRAAKMERANNTIRTEINSLNVGDATVSNMVADALHMTDTNGIGAKDMMNSLLHAEEITSLSKKAPLNIAVDKAVNSADLVDIANIGNVNTRYVKLVGEEAGSVLDKAPVYRSLADSVVGTKDISIKRAVLNKVDEYKFNTIDDWNPLKLKGDSAVTDSEARFIWSNQLKLIPKDTIVNENDLPLLQRIYKEQTQNNINTAYKIRYADGSVADGLSNNDLLTHIKNTKEDIASTLQGSMVSGAKDALAVENGTEAIAKITDVKQSYLEGTRSGDELSDLFAKDAADKQYNDERIAKGLQSASTDPVDTAFLPKYAKINYKAQVMQDVDGNVLDGMTWIKQQQELFQQAADRIFANYTSKSILDNAVQIKDSDLINATLKDGGAGFASFTNGGYLSLGSKIQLIGANVTRPLKEALRSKVQDTISSSFVKLAQDSEVAIGFQAIHDQVAKTSEAYVRDILGVTGEADALVSKKIYEFLQAKQEADAAGKSFNRSAPVLQKGAPEFIPINNEDVGEAITAHMEASADSVNLRRDINSVQGHIDNKDPDIFRTVPPNPNDYPFIAFVKDDTVSGAGHTTMLHAADEKTLLAMADKARGAGYKVLYKDQPEAYATARGEYDYSRTLNENYIDSDLQSKGINSAFFTKTDPVKIANDIVNYHIRQADVSATELVRMKYQPQFDYLEDRGRQISQLESSQYGTKLDQVEKFGKNPFTDYIKTALDVSKASEYSLLYNANRKLDSAVSNVVDKVRGLITGSKSPSELDGINNILQDAGINNAYYDAATNLLANHQAGKAELSKFIRTSNSIMSSFTLALDPLNALTNAIGANVLRSTELNSLISQISKGDSGAASDLTKAFMIDVPGVPGQKMLSPLKIQAQAYTNFFSDTGETMQRYRDNNWVKTASSQFKSIVDDFSLNGSESAIDLNNKTLSAYTKAKQLLSSASEFGQKVTGNALAEDSNRFVSANCADQITSMAVKQGTITQEEANSIINTFVNRVEGNTIASQRPVMFQGPIGQALGLFQSYQFNMMQQLFRYVGEGTAKDSAMLLGMQSTLFGINGFPGFNAINTHIVGNLSGNKNHTDLYDATYGILDKGAADFLMYGAPSSIIKTNLYSRGDINPRSLTIIPNSFKDIPIVSAYTKVLGGIYNTTQNIQGGGNVWESILQGMEHNGISRPLTGLAQTMQATTGDGQVFSTTNKGSLMGSNDLVSLATLSRLAGGRPLDEAIINDTTYRIQSYEADKNAQMQQLAEAIKTTTIQGQQADNNSINKFAAQYAALGGKQTQFNSYMMSQYTAANMPQAQKLLENLSSPFNQKMQVMMGGRDPIVSAARSSNTMSSGMNNSNTPSQ